MLLLAFVYYSANWMDGTWAIPFVQDRFLSGRHDVHFFRPSFFYGNDMEAHI